MSREARTRGGAAPRASSTTRSARRPPAGMREYPLMALSALDLFSVGIGPSSSHTVGPMRAARLFVTGLRDAGLLDRTDRVEAQLYGSLGATGHGHGSDKAVLLGLHGEDPETVDTTTADARAAAMRTVGGVAVLGAQEAAVEVTMHRRRSLPYHPNGMTFAARDAAGGLLRSR